MSPTWKLPQAELPADGTSKRVTVEGRTIALFRQGETLYAIDAKCTHVGGPLEKGTVANGAVTCPWHGSRFDLKTGAVQQGPARSPVRAYRVRTEGSELVLEGE